MKVPSYPKKGDLLKGKNIVITGATSGIGKAVALACSQHGAQLVLLGRNSRKLEAVADEIEAQCEEAQIHLYPLNLETAKDTDYQDAVGVLEQHFNTLHGLVHNAAALGNLSPLRHYNLVQWYKVMQTNLNAPIMLTQACLPLLEKSGATSVIFTTSGVAQKATPYWGAYGVSKCAHEYCMRLLAAEYDHTDLRSNAISPGAVATGMRARAFPAENPNTLVKPEQIVDAWLYLLSDESIGVSGQVIQAQPA